MKRLISIVLCMVFISIGIYMCSTLQMTSRYVANNTEAHVQANQDLAKKIMSFIPVPDQSNPIESKGTECKTDAKVVAKVVTDGGAGEGAVRNATAGGNGSDCDYAI